MALPRTSSLGRAFLSRGSSTRVASAIFLSARFTAPYRSISSTSRSFQATFQEDVTRSTNTSPPAPIPEDLQRTNARSVAIFKVPKRATKNAVKSMFENAGLSPANIHMRLDRFRFEGDTYAYVELADELQAKRAVEVLNGNEFLGSKVYFRALKPDYTWDLLPSQHRRFVVNNEAGIRDAIQPYLDGRRVRLSVKSPAWGKKGNVTQRRHTDLEVLERTFSKFGIEAISRVAPQHGQITLNPKYFCHIDFTTKKGADEAIHAFHNKEIEGVLVWVKNAEIDATKAYQIGTVNKAILTELQEKGQAPTEIDENLVSKFTKRDPMSFDRGRNSTDDSRQYTPRAESAV